MPRPDDSPEAGLRGADRPPRSAYGARRPAHGLVHPQSGQSRPAPSRRALRNMPQRKIRILRANADARNGLMQLERLSDSELTRMDNEILRVRTRQRGSPGAQE